MKRSYGNTKPERSGRRIRIFVAGQCVGFIIAPSLRMALERFYKQQLKPAGWADPIYVGNHMTAVVGDIADHEVVAVFAHEVRS